MVSHGAVATDPCEALMFAFTLPAFSPMHPHQSCPVAGATRRDRRVNEAIFSLHAPSPPWSSQSQGECDLPVEGEALAGHRSPPPLIGRTTPAIRSLA